MLRWTQLDLSECHRFYWHVVHVQYVHVLQHTQPYPYMYVLEYVLEYIPVICCPRPFFRRNKELSTLLQASSCLWSCSDIVKRDPQPMSRFPWTLLTIQVIAVLGISVVLLLIKGIDGCRRWRRRRIIARHQSKPRQAGKRSVFTRRTTDKER